MLMQKIKLQSSVTGTTVWHTLLFFCVSTPIWSFCVSFTAHHSSNENAHKDRLCGCCPRAIRYRCCTDTNNCTASLCVFFHSYLCFFSSLNTSRRSLTERDTSIRSDNVSISMRFWPALRAAKTFYVFHRVDISFLYTALSQLIYGFCLVMSLCSWFACCLFFAKSAPYKTLFSRQGAYCWVPNDSCVSGRAYNIWRYFFAWFVFIFLLHRVRPQFFLLRRAVVTLLPMHACL